MNIKEYFGFEDNKEFEGYIVSAIIMFLAILCLSSIARNYYMTTFEYIIYFVEVFVTGIIGYKMMMDDEHSIFTKMVLICFPLTFHIEWILLNDCLYLGLAILILLMILIMYYFIKCQKYLSIINQMIKIIVLATMVLSLALPLEVVYQLFFDHSILTSDAITISNEIETVMLLEDDKWQTLALKDKMKVLETIVQIELNELGVYNIPTLRYDSLGEVILGKYIDANNTIVMNKEFLNEGDSLEIIEALIHECRHKYQYTYIATYDLNDEKLSYNYFIGVKNAIDNYVDYSKDEEAYFNNYIEIDASNYAEKRIKVYQETLATF